MKQESKMLPGVFRAQKKDGTIYYRSSITFQNKHISLGSYSDELQAHQAYLLARSLTDDKTFTLTDYHKDSILNFEKWVVLLNFRDNKMYFKTPIYLLPKYFLYYLDSKTELKFDVDDLFYYSTHKIMRPKEKIIFLSTGTNGISDTLTLKLLTDITEYPPIPKMAGKFILPKFTYMVIL